MKAETDVLRHQRNIGRAALLPADRAAVAGAEATA
jgi:hypothetical protein